MKQLLFVGGCPRSGTTALTRLLNRHGDILLGNERYYRVIERGELMAGHFVRDRFLDIEAGDTHDEQPGGETGANPHWVGEDPSVRWDDARMVGDKYPPIFRAYDMVAERFFDAHIVYVLRNPVSVAESYQARAEDVSDRWPFDFARAIRDWNESVAATRSALERGLRITVVAYETVLRSAEVVAALAQKLGLEAQFARPVDGLLNRAAALADKPVRRNETIRRHVCLNADFENYRALAERAVA